MTYDVCIKPTESTREVVGVYRSLGHELLVGAVKTWKHVRGQFVSMGVEFTFPWIVVERGTACLPFLQAEDHGGPLIPTMNVELAF